MSVEPSSLPHRVVNRTEARREFGDLFDRLMPWLMKTDPLADDAIRELSKHPALWRVLDQGLKDGTNAIADAPEAIKALVEQSTSVPVWVDWQRINRAGQLMFRSGPVGGMVLGARSLILGYASPAGNKPLVLTGRLKTDATHRLAETSRFVKEVCMPGGMEPGGEGHRLTMHVRLMHARVRMMLDASGRWADDAWGRPINQHDMLATSLLFGQTWLDGVRQVGLRVTDQEAADWLHLWRWISEVLGVAPELLPTDESTGRQLTALIERTQEAPDEDSRRLVRSLLDAEEVDDRLKHFGYAACTVLVGRERAKALGVPQTPIVPFFLATGQLVSAAAGVAQSIRPLRERMVELGQRYWELRISQLLAGRGERFRAVERLAPN